MASSSSPFVSDDDFYQDGYHEMTEQEEEEYYSAYEQSEGFDVPSLPNCCTIGIIVPLCLLDLSPKDLNDLQVYAKEAINHYNKEHGTNFEFVKILKANAQFICGFLYYITFEVKPIGTGPELPTTTFQAKVLWGIPPASLEVQLCRPKPSN